MIQIDIVERLRFDAARCEAQFSKGVAGNIEEAAAKIERLMAAIKDVLNIWDAEDRPIPMPNLRGKIEALRSALEQREP